jgi:hypothetical protein
MKSIRCRLSIVFFFCLTISCVQKEKNQQKIISDKSQPEKSTDTTSDNDVPTGYPYEIAYNELYTLSKTDLRLARNSIYAKYGRAFKSEDLQDYFKSQPWYSINKNYSDSLLTDRERNLVKLIMCWEKANNVVWEQKVDLDNDKNSEECYLLDDTEDNKKLNLVVNDQIISFDQYQAEEDYFYGVQVKVVDIDQSDNRKEIWISQHYAGDEDPGKENLFITKVENQLLKAQLGSESYNAGTITFQGDGQIEMMISYCPSHIRTYRYTKNEFELVNEETGEIPPGGCPACFAADAKVLINTNNAYKLIKDLKIGDSVLTYDLELRKHYQTTIIDMVEMKHNNLVELIFMHDTITSTKDHPYYVFNKGWSSFKPSVTLARYSNYDSIKEISNGDFFILSNGEKSELIGHSYLNEERKTYTITQLKDGNTFYVNGILVGVEEIEKYPNNITSRNLRRTLQ